VFVKKENLKKIIAPIFFILLIFFSCEDDGITPNFGCMSSNACNYNTSANQDDGTCSYPCETEGGCATLNSNFDCDGICIAEGDHLTNGYDCTFVDGDPKTYVAACGGVEEEDCLFVCGGPAEEDCDDVCEGDAVVDNCDVCDNNPDNDCEADCNGLFEGENGYGDEFDDCGVCGGVNADNLGCGCFEPGPTGCDETCGSTLVNDACGVCGGNGSACSETVSYGSDIASILNSNCTSVICHDGDHSTGLDLRTNTSWSSIIANGVVVPGDADASDLYDRITRPEPASGDMPPSGTLSDSEKDLIRDWIDEGAENN